jgi:F-type H+-transporting ATPase subunit b
VQAEQIVDRARKAAENAEREAAVESRAKREELMAQTRRDIEAETHRAIQELRKEVADLTVLATEKVTRKTLDADDQRRLVEEALGELDFTALERGGRR